MKTYAGIGSRETPDDMLEVMGQAAHALSKQGWTLRSGCAPGADSAFEMGSFALRELYLPWPRFEGRHKNLVRLERPQPEAYAIAERFHPAWASLRPGVKSLHARNVHQILGPDVTTPILSRFVICWTKDGAGGGGTGQALRIAKAYDVPVFDLALPADLDRVMGLFE